MKSKRLFSVLFFIVVSMTVVPNAEAIAKYYAKPLKPVATLPLTEDCGISFGYKVFDRRDCKKFLGRDQMFKHGYQPVQLTITNKANTPFDFSLARLNVLCISADYVAECVRFNTTKRVVGWGVAGLFFWPLWIPAIMDSIEAPRANDMLFDDYAEKSLRDQVIQPHTTVNGVIFVSIEDMNLPSGARKIKKGKSSLGHSNLRVNLLNPEIAPQALTI